ncbi:MAG: response regulator [Candidatus Sumerlaeia bacterium]|nr:response regulator [Candidatus Sumerlaeia bacterium]
MKWRILIVDDEPDVRLILKTTLMEKFEVLEAHDGLDALEKVERYEPDFVLMDVMMPLMNGFEACESIRKMPRFSDLPVMFLTALGSKEDHMKGFKSGANRYLTKPFDPNRLLKNVEQLFDELDLEPRKRRYSIQEIHRFEDQEMEPTAPGSPTYKISTMETLRDPKIVSDSENSDTKREPEKPQPAIQDITPRVMVVDDDDNTVELIRVSLEGVCEVVSAGDGMSAIEKLVKYQPDILILDIMLPKMNGFQLCQSLRSNRAFSKIPILVCSAKSADRDISMAKRLGANEFLAKPFSPSVLLGKISDLQSVPGFRLRPKTYTIEQIEDLEGRKREKTDVFEAEEPKRRDGSVSAQNLQSFLSKQSNKAALGKEEDKKKRRLFGFGSEQ